MKTQRIYAKDADYQRFEVLKTNRNKRYKYHEFFVEGVRNINEAIKNNWTINSFIYPFEKKLSDWAANVIASNETKINYELTNELIDELSGKDDSSELMMIAEMREDSTNQFILNDNPIFALFDRPSNKGNLGTVIRSCDALGIQGLVVTGHAVDIYDPDTIVASIGSFFKLPVIRMVDNNAVTAWICELKEKYQGFKVIGTSSHSNKAIYKCDMTKPLLFMIGNETDGLCGKFKEISDEIAVIPMDANSVATSFNVACAASIMFYEAVRQRA